MIIVLNDTVFSENLRRLRKKYHFSQEELARKLDISTDALLRLEAGEMPLELSSEILLSLRKLFQMKTEELIHNPL